MVSTNVTERSALTQRQMRRSIGVVVATALPIGKPVASSALITGDFLECTGALAAATPFRERAAAIGSAPERRAG
jgi:hypothetical protein